MSLYVQSLSAPAEENGLSLQAPTNTSAAMNGDAASNQEQQSSLLKRCVVSVEQLALIAENREEIQNGVEVALRKKNGVLNIAFASEATSVEVVFDGNLIKCARCICKAITDAGYSAEIKVAAYVIDKDSKVALGSNQNRSDVGLSSGGLGDVLSAGGDSNHNNFNVLAVTNYSRQFQGSGLEGGDCATSARFERTLYISGMTCHSCVTAIESKVKSLPGIYRAKVFLVDEKGCFVYNSNVTKLKDIVSCIKELGFEVSEKPSDSLKAGTNSVKNEKNVTVSNPIVKENYENAVEISPSSNDVSITVAIKGMSCSSCVAKIEGDVHKLQGVKGISVSLIGEKGVIILDPALISTDSITKIIKSMGYDCQVLETKCGKKTTSSVQFIVNGMLNESSGIEIQSCISRLEGVESCLVDNVLSTVNVTYQSETTGARKLLEGINSMGYSAQLKRRQDTVDHSETIYKWRRSGSVSFSH